MQVTFDSLSVLTLSGIAQAIVLAVALFKLKRGNTSANRILAAFLGVAAICLGGLVLAYTKYILIVPHLAQIHIPFGTLLAPLLFLYVKILVSRQNNLRRSDFLHFIPFALIFIYLLPFYIQAGDDKISYLSQALENYPLEWRVRSAFVFVQQMIYLLLVYRLLSRKNPDAPAQKPDLYLARFFTATFSIVWLVGVIRFLFAHQLETNLLAPFIGCIFICGLVFKVLQKPEVLGAENVPESKKYEKSTLKPEQAGRHLEKILDLMKNEKLYLDGNLTLEKLARKAAIAPPHLSQLINENLNQNFADFINSYRVEEFKERLSNSQNDRYTIVAVAKASGFNSKSAFHTAFKKHTNLTPSEFKKTLFARS